MRILFVINVLLASFRLGWVLSARIVRLERAKQSKVNQLVVIVARANMPMRQGPQDVNRVQRGSIPSII
jgi:hypothetical protein